jgi:hypothetical protein
MRIPHLRNEIDAVVNQPWPEECIIFSGKQQPNGYGRVSIDGQYRRSHVYACEKAHGPCPAGKRDAAHACGKAMCINPRHLRWASRAENEADKRAHGRTNQGERGGGSRLTPLQVSEIRERWAAGEVTQTALAQQNGVHVMTINDIVHRRTWKHI